MCFLQKYSCYYHGQVDGIENSVVALSDCHGLRLVIVYIYICISEKLAW